MIRLAAALQDQLPDELVAVGEVEVVVEFGGTTGPATVRVPDVIVRPLTVAEQNPARWRMAAVARAES